MGAIAYRHTEPRVTTGVPLHERHQVRLTPAPDVITTPATNQPPILIIEVRETYTGGITGQQRSVDRRR